MAQTIAPLKISLINFINAKAPEFLWGYLQLSGLHVPTYGIYILLTIFNFSLRVIKEMQTKWRFSQLQCWQNLQNDLMVCISWILKNGDL